LSGKVREFLLVGAKMFPNKGQDVFQVRVRCPQCMRKCVLQVGVKTFIAMVKYVLWVRFKNSSVIQIGQRYPSGLGPRNPPNGVQ
jgi:hypothetical protein